MMLALHGAKPIPEYDSSKEKHWGKRKLKRRMTILLGVAKRTQRLAGKRGTKNPADE
jgi:hypothetical protein